jgi:RNA polymerase sigma-70 factor (ECF subfamily)
MPSPLWSSEFDRLLRAAQSGCREAQGRLLEACRADLARIAEPDLDSQIRAKVGVSDVVQESLLEAHRDFASFRGQTPQEFYAWLKRILRSNLLNHFRAWRTQARQLDRQLDFEAAGLRDSHLIDGGGTTASAILNRQEQQEKLNRAVSALCDDYRQVIQLRHYEGLSFEEIGRRIGRSPDAARMLWYRAFDRLSREFDPAGLSAK